METAKDFIIQEVELWVFYIIAVKITNLETGREKSMFLYFDFFFL